MARCQEDLAAKGPGTLEAADMFVIDTAHLHGEGPVDQVDAQHTQGLLLCLRSVVQHAAVQHDGVGLPLPASRVTLHYSLESGDSAK